MLNRLIQSVQESDTDQLEQLLRRFRSIASSDNDDTNTDQPGGTQGSTQSPTLSLQRMRIGDAISPRNCVHSIHRWTTIVDDATASRLLSLYFNLDGLIWTLVDQELFLQDLNDGRSRFCSPLLLHVLLFYACVSSIPTRPLVVGWPTGFRASSTRTDAARMNSATDSWSKSLRCGTERSSSHR